MNYLTTKNPKKMPTKSTKPWGLLGAYLGELGGKLEEIFYKSLIIRFLLQRRN
jgi:hypothetical protein